MGFKARKKKSKSVISKLIPYQQVGRLFDTRGSVFELYLNRLYTSHEMDFIELFDKNTITWNNLGEAEPDYLVGTIFNGIQS